MVSRSCATTGYPRSGSTSLAASRSPAPLAGPAPKVTAIVAAAGRGTRFGAPENKVFASLAGRSLLFWSLRALEHSPSIDAIVVATGAEDRARAAAAVAEGAFSRVVSICEGGAERHDT